MSPPLATAVDTLRRPEYTGENRCVPCTVVNLLIAVVLTVAVAVAVRPLGTVAVAVSGLAVLVVSIAAIYLRGYLVPGTPRLTRTYFPDSLLRAFGKAGSDPPGAPPDLGNAEPVLRDAGAVTGEDARLTEEFHAAWRDRIADVREGDAAEDAFAGTLGIDPAELSFEAFGEMYVALVERREIDSWESRAAFVADAAGATLMQERYDRWDDLGLRARSRVLDALRGFLDRCPSCDGRLETSEDPAESCCRSITVTTVTCSECGSRVFESE